MENSTITNPCANCGDEIPEKLIGEGGRKAKYCSATCRVYAWRAKKAKERGAKIRAELAKLDPNSPEFQRLTEEAARISRDEIRKIAEKRENQALNGHRLPGRPLGARDSYPRKRRKSS